MISDRLVALATRVLERRTSRRGLLVRTAIVGSAVATAGADYVLRPGTAYASVCGSGASCSSGWTAMCCTVNHGVNQCPPGSFAGGWWKADGASLCGGHARYYVDCQAKCTHCRCHGSAFCSEHCWDCKPHCAHGDCDKRKVCHNVFRYGQCRHDISCSGPVLCRAISCTPPWKWESCSSRSATDNFTVSHSSSCLSTWSRIQERYKHMGSQGSVLGASKNAEYRTEHGHVQRFQHGRMYWSRATDAHWLQSHVLDRYLFLGETGSPLGLPTSDFHEIPGGHAALFQHGGIFGRTGLIAHGLWGAVWSEWGTHQRYAGPLGYPTTDVRDIPGGQLAQFVRGTIYSRDGGGTFSLWAATARRYTELKATRGGLGWPTSDTVPTTTADDHEGAVATFEHGVLAGRSGHAYVLFDPILGAWDDHGAAKGELGFPVTDIQPTDNGQQCRFEHGLITYDSSTGEITVTTF